MVLKYLTALTFAGAAPAWAAPESYTIDPGHTAPSFEVSHAGGISIVRGLFRKTSGKVTLDRAAKSGSMEIMVDTASLVTGNERRDNLVREWFKVDQFPSMVYRSQNLTFSGDDLVGADGELTMVGVTKPVNLTITLFRCIVHPVNKRQLCGADGTARIKRTEFGMTALGSAGDDVKILFQIEAYKD